jgi:cytochrome P450
MRIIAKTLFDANLDDTAAIGDAITVALHEVDDRFNRLILLPNWAPTASNRAMKDAVAKLDAIIQRFIDDRRASGEDKGDLLSMLLMARDEDTDGVMTDKQVRDEAMTLFGAGHETTAHALSWTWYALSQHPDAEARLHAELAEVLGGRAPTLEDLPRLKYTEQVVKEAMRLYPPAWTTTREAIADIELGGYPIRKGEVVVLPIYTIHRDPRYFPDPERFDPDRFSPEREKDIPKYAYLPFGGGPRVCIGNAFALMEARLIVATMAQRFSFSVAPGQIIEPQRMFTLRPKNGMRMIAHARMNEAALA